MENFKSLRNYLSKFQRKINFASKFNFPKISPFFVILLKYLKNVKHIFKLYIGYS